MKKRIFFFFLLFALCLTGCLENQEKSIYIVSFNSNGGSEVASQSVIEGQCAIEPLAPQREEFIFIDWYLEDLPYDFNSAVLQDITLVAHWENEFDSFGMDVISLKLSDITISESGVYTSMEEVGGYIYTYHSLPSNFKTKGKFNKADYTTENKLSVGGDQFYNREGLLPYKKGRTYTECDIDYKGASRNAKRIVFSSDWLIFYTEDHYSSFSILRFI
ncbi:MAG: InlB B-repeat-containing protein [Anaeroplasmataceae bacterium]|nr:InlB B-repeat-containing protein [Anaeroplasmataceae bacterium]